MIEPLKITFAVLCFCHTMQKDLRPLANVAFKRTRIKTHCMFFYNI